MARFKIVWTLSAELDLMDIFEYYNKRNQSTKFSKKLLNRLQKTVKSLSKNPLLGLTSNIDSVRIIIHKDYQIVYEIKEVCILILVVWDSRQNPDNFRWKNYISDDTVNKINVKQTLTLEEEYKLARIENTKKY